MPTVELSPEVASVRKPRSRRSLPYRSLFQLIFWLAVVATAWFFLAPTSLGGYNTYVVTEGHSMLPVIHGNGVVVTRARANYHVGEIVAYHDPQLKNDTILHKIIAIDNDHYTFKGINNPKPDLYHPVKSNLVGEKWIYWPNGGQFVANVKIPWVGAVVLGLLGMWAFADIGTSDRSRRHSRHHTQ